MNTKRSALETSSINVMLPPTATEPLADPDLYRFWYNYKHRFLWIDSEISYSTIDIVNMIIEWNVEDKDIALEDRKPIIIMFHSPGGDIDVQQMLSHAIEMSETPIYGVAMGMVASAASQIYLSCHNRFAFPNSYFVLHQGSGSFSGNYKDLIAAIRDYEKTVEDLTQSYIDKTLYTEEEIRENLLNGDWYVYTDEACEKGIVDEVINDYTIFLQ